MKKMINQNQIFLLKHGYTLRIAYSDLIPKPNILSYITDFSGEIVDETPTAVDSFEFDDTIAKIKNKKCWDEPICGTKFLLQDIIL